MKVAYASSVKESSIGVPPVSDHLREQVDF